MTRLASVLLAIGFGIAPSAHAQQIPAKPPLESPTLKHPIELCQKLAGIERDICDRQARERPGPVLPGVGATPGIGAEGQRGNTPPGTSRSGDPPAAGAIVDPAGVTKGLVR